MKLKRSLTKHFIAALAIATLCAIGCDIFKGKSIDTTPTDGGRNLGINLFASQLDWVEDRMFADVMKTCREWKTPNNYGNGALVSVDAGGWPTVDAETVVWHGITRMNGTYRLEGLCAQRPTETAISTRVTCSGRKKREPSG